MHVLDLSLSAIDEPVGSQLTNRAIDEPVSDGLAIDETWPLLLTAVLWGDAQ